MVIAPSTIAAMTPGGTSRAEGGVGVELGTGAAEVLLVDFCEGVDIKVAPASVGVVVRVSSFGASTTVVASGVLSVRIVCGRAAAPEMVGRAEMSGRERGVLLAEMSGRDRDVLLAEGFGLSVVEIRALVLSTSSWSRPKSPVIAKAGQKLTFEGSLSGTMAIVKTRPARTSSLESGPTMSPLLIVW